MKNDFSVATHCLVFLAHHPNQRFSSSQLAENVCTNSVTIRRVLGSLHKKNLVDVVNGPKGGYSLVMDPSAIRLGDLYCYVGADTATAKQYTGSVDIDCLVSSNMGKVMQNLSEELIQEQIRYLNTKTVADIHEQIKSFQ